MLRHAIVRIVMLIELADNITRATDYLKDFQKAGLVIQGKCRKTLFENILYILRTNNIKVCIHVSYQRSTCMLMAGDV